MSATEELERQKQNRILHSAYNTDFSTIAMLMRSLEIRQQYAREFHNNPNSVAREQLYEMIEHVNKDIKVILGL